jgi:hypothetical protein
MSHKRFPAARILRIVAWTTMSTAWATTLLARVTGWSPQAVTADPNGGTTATVPSSNPVEAVPTMPAEGLVVIRVGPQSVVGTPNTVPTTTVPSSSGGVASGGGSTQHAPTVTSPPVTVPAPPPVTSSGS